MPRTEPTILTNMCMIYDDDRILVMDRVGKYPGLTFPGGHVEAGESLVSSVIREIKEETGLTVSQLELCGVQNWTEEEGAYRYLVFFYKTNQFSGQLKSSDEGEVFWINRSDLANYQLANSFSEMLEVFETPHLTENYYWFENNQWQMRNK